MTDKNPDNDEPTFFVSRRGRQVGINQVDLKGIDVDDDPSTKSPAQAAPKKQAPKSKRTRGGLTRRKKGIFAVIILTILLVPFVTGELVAAQYRAGIPAAKSTLESIVSKSVLPAQKKPSLTADSLRGIANEVDEIVGGMCRGGLLDNMASLYPRASNALKDCKDNQAEYASLVSALRQFEKETRYLERVDTVMKPAATPITDEFAVIAAQQTAWQEASEALNKLSPSGEMQAAHLAISANVKAIAENWSKLNQATSAQDAAAFMEAEKVLASEYEALRSASAGFNQVLQAAQTRVTTSYDALR